MEGNPGRRLITPRPAHAHLQAQRCVDCVSAVLHAVLTRAATLTALFDANRRTGVPGPDAPLWTIDLLVADNDRHLDGPSDSTGGGAVVELGQNGAGA